MRKNIAKAIIYNPEHPALVFAETLTKGSYCLPSHHVPMGSDPVKELKHEVVSEHGLQIQFVKVLPNSWSELIFLHSNLKDSFTIVYIFKASPEQFALIRKNRQGVLVDLKKPIPIEFDEQDKAALQHFAELYGIIQTDN